MNKNFSKIVILLVMVVVLIFCFFFNQKNNDISNNDNYKKKDECTLKGEQLYSDYITQEPNIMMSIFDIEHEIVFSQKTNACLEYIGVKFKEANELGLYLNKDIYDVLNNKLLYQTSSDGKTDMSLSGTTNSIVSLNTDQEFMDKKNELFNQN